ncbi:MAG TPA: Uma2 family endonuclease [Spirillospora sp.]|nr:Uma2 family endonuclease [Spirillospora sp.]
MSAQSIDTYAESGHMEPEPLPDWVIPPPGGFTADDFLRMRGLPRHTELIDGSLVFVSPQRMWHSWLIRSLANELDRQAPSDLRALDQMTLKLAERQAPEPDVSVFKAEAWGMQRTHLLPDEVVLVIEVVSPESKERDRDTKPRRYAAAGIRHFWRVEEDGERTVVYVYEIDPASGDYFLTGIHHDRLKATVPFDIEIDLAAIDAHR